MIEAKWTQAFSPPRPVQIQRVAEIVGPDLLAAEHLIVARPQQDYPLSSTPPVRIVNGFLYRFV